MVKYYSIKVGRKTGVYDNWTEAQKQVNGFSGAVYKSFSTKSEALAFLNNSPFKSATSISNDQLVAYVDGSFDSTKKVYGSGVVIIENNLVTQKISIKGNDSSYIESYQIAGEVIGALKAISYAVDSNYRNIEVHYDYEGIEKWALGNWKAKKAISNYYVREYSKLTKNINVIFVKVKAHSGDYYNELADSLAREATTKICEISTSIKEPQNNFNELTGHKKNLYLNFNYAGKIISSESILKEIKKVLKTRNIKVKDIVQIKTLIDIDTRMLRCRIESLEDKIDLINIPIGDLS